ncbi:hypothetical protein [Serratia sp. 2723]|uniref:hypothetical protein n=1 Tax=unclassified Serratia (in: enterobacteria) TaxID=2647522 RepID=UPI003D1C74E9
MSHNMLDEVNNKLRQEILREREVRNTAQDSYLSVIPKSLRFRAASEQYHMKEIIALCKDDYRDLVVALMTKDLRDNIKGYYIIDKFRSRPLVFVSLLSLHPAAKVKLLGKTRFIAVKFLMKNPRLMDVARKIYRKFKG